MSSHMGLYLALVLKESNRVVDTHQAMKTERQ